MTPTAASLSIFRHLFASVAEEMGVTLERAAYSPNIKERLDFSCALFLGNGRMLAQAAHIPVHLGAMPSSVKAAINQCTPFQPGDVVILNDPYQGGNHLPDITIVSPVFINIHPPNHPTTQPPQFFVASRAHHADVGGMSPGSMPLSTELYQEGIIIPPIKLVEAGKRNEGVWQLILRNVRTPDERDGDLAAQLAAHATGAQRLADIVARYGLEESLVHADALIDYANRLTRTAVSRIPNGRYTFTDHLDNDGQSDSSLPIQVTITINGAEITVDFAGTTPAVAGNLNAVPAITESAVGYCLRCAALAILETDIPMNQGAFDPITVIIEPGSLLDPHPPHAVAAGNVETSQRIVDVVFGALAQALPNIIPAAGQGTMNNLTFGGVVVDKETAVSTQFAYYETIGGGSGAGPTQDGGSGMHVHMSNTLNTPVEALEYSYPLRIQEYSLRHGSGGNGLHHGGDGLVRSIQFLIPVQVTVTSERRQHQPYGLHGGQPGLSGQNSATHDGKTSELTGKFTAQLDANDILKIETPGGGGWGDSA
ncbi:MAG: hydantoinase B/oxoprolinase family protein [Chloroflexi bacterium]|nr:MAG: hydantoinase B/oxoprolinase family protein [Chloroflexota bacterium]